MVKILVVADIHGEFEKFSKMMDKLKKEKFDFIICPGDFTDMHNIPEGYSQMDIAEVIIQKMLSFGKPVFCVPGNHEPYDILELFDEYDVNVHMKHKKINEFEIVGFGGAATPFNTKFEPSEDEIKEGLDKMMKKITKKFILVTHNPPYNTMVDKTDTGEHVGSKNVREFIENNSPVFAISAHIHEAIGTDKIGKTSLFYPGPAYEGKYGIITVGKNITYEIKKIT